MTQSNDEWACGDLRNLAIELQQFAADRDWEQFHSAKNLVMALAKEAAELMEPFQWLSLQQSANLDQQQRRAVADEIGDVLIYLVRLSDRLGIDPLLAAKHKLEKNRAKYPVERVKGSAAKYTEYKSD